MKILRLCNVDEQFDDNGRLKGGSNLKEILIRVSE